MTNTLNIMNVTKITTKLIKHEKKFSESVGRELEEFYIRKFFITQENGEVFEVECYSDLVENVELKKHEIVY